MGEIGEKVGGMVMIEMGDGGGVIGGGLVENGVK